MPKGPAGTDGDKSGRPAELSSSIVDWKSFDHRTSGERAVAGLLFYKELDFLIDLAHCISLDFFDNPQLYRDVTDNVVRDLTELRARYGYQEDFLSREQRHQIFAGVFGERDQIFAGVFGEREGTGGPLSAIAPPAAESFVAQRDQLLAASMAFTERVFNTSEEILRRAVRIMHVYLKDYLKDATGASVAWSRTVAFPAISKRCYRILRDPQVAARFGVNRQPGPNWPVAVDANGSKLVEQITGTPTMRMQTEKISRGVFNDKQQLALRGADALAAIMDYDGETDHESVDLLISRCYDWFTARGRVLRLPVAVAPPANMALEMTRPTSSTALGAPDSSVPASGPPASGSAIELQPMNGYGNRSLFGAATPELRR
jgi:hypothetical protein